MTTTHDFGIDHSKSFGEVIIAHPHILVWATSERWVPTLVATSGSHWLKQLWKWPPVGRSRSLVARTSMCGWAISYMCLEILVMLSPLTSSEWHVRFWFDKLICTNVGTGHNKHSSIGVSEIWLHVRVFGGWGICPCGGHFQNHKHS